MQVPRFGRLPHDAVDNNDDVDADDDDDDDTDSHKRFMKRKPGTICKSIITLNVSMESRSALMLPYV